MSSLTFIYTSFNDCAEAEQNGSKKENTETKIISDKTKKASRINRMPGISFSPQGWITTNLQIKINFIQF